MARYDSWEKEWGAVGLQWGAVGLRGEPSPLAIRLGAQRGLLALHLVAAEVTVDGPNVAKVVISAT